MFEEEKRNLEIVSEHEDISEEYRKALEIKGRALWS